MRQRRTYHKLRSAAGITLLACLSTGLAACASSSGSSAQSPGGANNGLSAGGSADGSGSATKSPIVIGFTGDLSGVTAFLDQPYLAGLKTRFHEINDAGGVGGHPLTLDVVDQTDNLAQAQASFHQLDSSTAVAVLGGGIQTNAFTFVPIADQEHLAMTYYASTPQLDGNPYFFGTENSVRSTGHGAGDLPRRPTEGQGHHLASHRDPGLRGALVHHREGGSGEARCHARGRPGATTVLAGHHCGRGCRRRGETGWRHSRRFGQTTRPRR